MATAPEIREAAIRKAEAEINRILRHLEDEIGKDILSVEVDTRNFTRLAVSISVQ